MTIKTAAQVHAARLIVSVPGIFFASVAAQAWVLLYLTGPSHIADCEASELLRIDVQREHNRR